MHDWVQEIYGKTVAAVCVSFYAINRQRLQILFLFMVCFFCNYNTVVISQTIDSRHENVSQQQQLVKWLALDLMDLHCVLIPEIFACSILMFSTSFYGYHRWLGRNTTHCWNSSLSMLMLLFFASLLHFFVKWYRLLWIINLILSTPLCSHHYPSICCSLCVCVCLSRSQKWELDFSTCGFPVKLFFLTTLRLVA